MINGNVPFRKNYYVLSLDKRNDASKANGDGNIKIISPAQSTVDEARSEIEQEIDINMSDIANLNQSGGGASRSKSKKSTRKPTKARKKSTEQPKNISKKSPIKQNKKSKRQIWM